MSWAIIENGSVKEVIREPRAVTIGDIQHPETIFRLWPAEDLKIIGVYPVTEQAVDELHSIISTSFVIEGDLVREQHVTVEKPAEPIKQNLLARVNQIRDQKLNGGIVWNGEAYQTDEANRLNLVGAMVSAQAALQAARFSLPEGETLVLSRDFIWRTMDNKDIPMTAEEIAALGNAVNKHVSDCYRAAWSHKERIKSISSIYEAVSHDLNSGWPENPQISLAQ